MNPLTLSEVIEALSSLDEVELIELLGVRSEQIAQAFKDLIEEDLERFSRAAQEYL